MTSEKCRDKEMEKLHNEEFKNVKIFYIFILINQEGWDRLNMQHARSL